eukprot:201761-Amphidinium_carterae.1
MRYVALRDSPPGPDSWMWPFPPEEYHTSWMACATTHVVLIEAGGDTMLVLSRIQGNNQIMNVSGRLDVADRGGNPLLTAEEIRHVLRMPNRTRLFTSHVLLVP